MKSYLFIIYYINIDGLSQQRAAEILQRFYQATEIKQTAEEKKTTEIIQQYLPVMHQPTHVQFFSHPNTDGADKNKSKLDQMFRHLKSNIERYDEKLKDNREPINSFEEI